MVKKKLRKLPEGGGAKTKRGKQAMVYLVAAVMLLSAFYMVTRSVPTAQPAGDAQSKVNEYSVQVIGNTSVLVQVGEARREIIAVPADLSSVSGEVILELANYSSENITFVTVDYTNAFVFFRFTFASAEPPLDEVNSLVKSWLRGARLYRLYNGRAGNEGVELVAALDLEAGDFVHALLLARTDREGAITALAQKNVPAGPDIPGTVVWTGGRSGRALYETDADFTALKKALNLSELTVKPVRISVEGLDPAVAAAVEELDGVTVEASGNTSSIAANASVAEVEAALGLVEYGKTAGSVTFPLADDALEAEVSAAAEAAGFSNATVLVAGGVETVPYYSERGIIVTVPKPENYSVNLRLGAQVGDEVTIRPIVLEIFGKSSAFSGEQV